MGILLTDLNESALVSLGKFNRMCEQQKQQVPQETSSKLKKSDFFTVKNILTSLNLKMKKLFQIPQKKQNIYIRWWSQVRQRATVGFKNLEFFDCLGTQMGGKSQFEKSGKKCIFSSLLSPL